MWYWSKWFNTIYFLIFQLNGQFLYFLLFTMLTKYKTNILNNPLALFFVYVFIFTLLIYSRYLLYWSILWCTIIKIKWGILKCHKTILIFFYMDNIFIAVWNISIIYKYMYDVEQSRKRRLFDSLVNNL